MNVTLSKLMGEAVLKILWGCNGSTKETVAGKSSSDASVSPDITVWPNGKDTYNPADTSVDTEKDIFQLLDTVWPDTAEETTGVEAVIPPDTYDTYDTYDAGKDVNAIDTADSETAVIIPTVDALDAGDADGVSAPDTKDGADVTLADVVEAGEAGTDVPVAGEDTPVAGEDAPITGVDTPVSGEDLAAPETAINPEDAIIYTDVPSKVISGMVFSIDPSGDQCYAIDPVKTAACVILTGDDELNAKDLFNSSSTIYVTVEKGNNAKEPSNFNLKNVPGFQKQFIKLEPFDIAPDQAIWSIVKYTEYTDTPEDNTFEFVGTLTTTTEWVPDADGQWYQSYITYVNGSANLNGEWYKCLWKDPAPADTPTPDTCGKNPI